LLAIEGQPFDGSNCLPRVGPNLTPPCARLVAIIPIVVAKRFALAAQAEVRAVTEQQPVPTCDAHHWQFEGAQRTLQLTALGQALRRDGQTRNP